MKPLTGKELASEIHRLYAEIREKSKLADAQMKEISRLQVLASKQEAEIHAKEMLICSLTRGKREQDAEIAQLKELVREAEPWIDWDICELDCACLDCPKHREWLAKAKQALGED